MRFTVCLALLVGTLSVGAAAWATYRQTHDECWHGRTSDAVAAFVYFNAKEG
jgi:hypothetical protein